MYRMSLMSLFPPPSLASRLNIPHCMKMALIHDLAESLVGDITPVDGVPKTEKSRRESATIDYLTKSLLGRVNGGHAGKDIRRIWQEYEESETLEAKFIHDVDKIELMLQMVEYEKTGRGKIDLSEFSGVATRIKLPEVKEWSAEVLEEREEFWKGFFDLGVLTLRSGENSIRFRPPLDITSEVIDEAMDAMRKYCRQRK